MASTVPSRRDTRSVIRPRVDREGAGRLPQFAFPEPAFHSGEPQGELELGDADKTLKRRTVRAHAASSEEIGADDILEEIDRPKPIAESARAASAATPRRGAAAKSASPNATQDVSVGDILEVVDQIDVLLEAPKSEEARQVEAKKVDAHEIAKLLAPRSSAIPLGRPRPSAAAREARTPTSFAPVSFEVALPVCRIEPSIEIDWDLAPMRPRRSMTPIVAGAMVVAFGIVAAAVVRHGVRSDAVEPPIALLASPSKVAASVPPTPIAFVQAPAPRVMPIAVSRDVPVVDVATLPRSPLGTVIGVAGHRLFIDGHVARSASAEVKCGLHVVKVGSAGAAKMIDVPCGGEISVR